MLYHDDGDGRFRVDEDIQVVDDDQSVVLMSFLASPEFEPESCIGEDSRWPVC